MTATARRRPSLPLRMPLHLAPETNLSGEQRMIVAALCRESRAPTITLRMAWWLAGYALAVGLCVGLAVRW